MKKKLCLGLICLCITCASVTTYAASIDKAQIEARVAAMSQDEKNSRAEEIKARLHEIKEMDKSQLSKEEKTALKHELKEMKKEAKVLRGGVYLSVGAILIIILVLILIL